MEAIKGHSLYRFRPVVSVRGQRAMIGPTGQMSQNQEGNATGVLLIEAKYRQKKREKKVVAYAYSESFAHHADLQSAIMTMVVLKAAADNANAERSEGGAEARWPYPATANLFSWKQLYHTQEPNAKRVMRSMCGIDWSLPQRRSRFAMMQRPID